MLSTPSRQLTLFDFPSTPRYTVRLRPLRYPIWTENKAKLIERYLYYFVLVTKHGIYIDGFAGPQQPNKPETWAAKLVLESEPRRLRKFFLYDSNANKVEFLKRLKQEQPARRRGELRRTVEVKEADFNLAVRELIGSGQIGEREATFCLLDQRTFECHWSTIEALARHRERKFKIELFYFLPIGWLDRAVAAQRDPSMLLAWWGASDWHELLKVRGGQQRALFFCARLQQQFHYKSVYPWPIFEKIDGGRVMYFMIHATDHPEAPNLMHRAYRRAVSAKEEPEQFCLEFEEWKSTGKADRGE